jgi:hypothetical protein
MTHDDLIRLYKAGKATLSVDHVNHREFVYNGVRYFVGYSSKRNPCYVKTSWDANEYEVLGWIVYKQELEAIR